MRKLLSIFLITCLLLICTKSVFADTQILMPAESVELFRHSHVFPWRFYNEFGWFPDREDSTLTANADDWWLDTTKKLTYEEQMDIYEFALEKSNFFVPVGWHKIILYIDYDGIIDNFKNYIADNDSNMASLYIADGEYQRIYFSRELTNDEKASLKDLIASYITYE